LDAWFDATRAAQTETWIAADFGAEDGGWLQADHATALDFSGLATLSIELWRRPNGAEIWQGGCYLAACNFGVAGEQSFALVDADDGDQIRVYVFKSDGTICFATTTNAPPAWSRLLLVFDLPATYAYFDDATTSADFDRTGSPGWPNEFASGQSAPLTVGAFGDETSEAHDSGPFLDSMGPLRFWARAFSGVESAQGWNDGLPRLHAELALEELTDVMVSYNMNEASGARQDQVFFGNHLLERGGTVRSIELVMSLTARAPAEAISLAAPSFYRAPSIDPAGPIGDRRALRFGGAHYLRANIVGLFDERAAGDVAWLAKFDSPAGLHVVLAIGGEEGHLLFGADEGVPCVELFGPAMLSGELRSEETLSEARPNVVSTRAVGAGAAASWSQQINGIETPATLDAAIENLWLSECGELQTLTLGALEIEGEASDFLIGALDTVLIYGGDAPNGSLNANEAEAVDAWLNRLFHYAPPPEAHAEKLRLKIDAARQDLLTLDHGALLSRADGQYLECATPTPAMLGISTGLSVSFFRNADSLIVASEGRTYLSMYDWDTTGRRGFAVYGASGDEAEQQLEICCRTAEGGGTGVLRAWRTTDAPKNWSHCLLTLDLTQTGASAVAAYFDGSPTSATINGGSGNAAATTVLTAQMPSLVVGTFGNSSSSRNDRSWDGALARLKIWNRPLLATNSSALWNDGDGLTAAAADADTELSEQLVGAWDLTEASGNRADSASVNHLVEQNGPIGRANICRRIGLPFPEGAAMVASYWTAPRWVSHSPIRPADPAPALRFGGNHWMKRGVADGFCANCHAGDIFCVIHPTLLDEANYAVLSANRQDMAHANRSYMLPMLRDQRMGLRVRGSDGDHPNATVCGSTTLTAGQTYVTNQRGLGVGDVESFVLRLNGGADAIDGALFGYGANNSGIWNSWYASCGPFAELSLGAENYFSSDSPPTDGDTAQYLFHGYIATIIIYGEVPGSGSLSEAENLAIEAELLAEAGIETP